MAPSYSKSSKMVKVAVEIGQVTVEALVDSGAEASCCGEKWYERNKHVLGGLLNVNTRVIGVEERPIPIKSRTQPLELKWGQARTQVSLLVVPTLQEHDVILGMDVMEQLGVHIDAGKKTAEPTILPTYIRPGVTWRIPARSSVLFHPKNPIPEGKVLYEPSFKLPGAVRSVATLCEGAQLKIRLDNTGEEDQLINPEWEIGTVQTVEIPERRAEKEKKKRRNI